MKRVCMVRHSYYPEIAPSQRNAAVLTAHGYEVDVICLKNKGKKSYEVIDGVSVHRLPIEHHRNGVLRYIFEYSAFFFLVMWKLGWLSWKRKYRVVEVSGIPDFLVFATIFPKIFGVKIVLHLLDHTPGVCADHFKVGAGHPVVRLLRVVEKACAHWANHVVTTQSTSKEILVKSGIPAAKISVVLNTPDEDVFRYLSSPSVNGSSFCLITHGSIVERYNIQTLIRAVPLLLKEIPELKVMIVGDGEYLPRLKELVQTFGVGECVDFTGRVPFEEIPAYIAQAHIGIVAIPTGMNPAMPLKLLEYLAMGKPAVVTSFPTIKAYFNDDSMMFYNPGDEHDLARCVLELYRNPEKRHAVAAMGAAIYEKYRWSKIKLEYLKVFDRLTDGAGLPRCRREKG